MPEEKSLPKPQKDLPLPEKDLPLPEKEIPANASGSAVVKNEKLSGRPPILKFILLGVLFVIGLSLIAGAYIMEQNSKSENQQAIQTEVVHSPTPTSAKTYTPEDVGFSATIPDDMNINCSSEILCYFDRLKGIGNASNFLYVSKENDKGFLTYNADGYDILNELSVGESKSLSNLDSASDNYFIYKRLPDMQIDGITAKVFENTRPWEFWDGTIERRVYVEKDGKTYLIGGYVDSQNSRDDSITLEELQTFFSTFKFTETEDVLITAPPGANPTGGAMVACTMDAKLCPDGSSVGRSGPNCEFAPCPGE